VPTAGRRCPRASPTAPTRTSGGHGIRITQPHSTAPRPLRDRSPREITPDDESGAKSEAAVAASRRVRIPTTCERLRIAQSGQTELNSRWSNGSSQQAAIRVWFTMSWMPTVDSGVLGWRSRRCRCSEAVPAVSARRCDWPRLPDAARDRLDHEPLAPSVSFQVMVKCSSRATWSPTSHAIGAIDGSQQGRCRGSALQMGDVHRLCLPAA
jgi:hypothetical protein